MNTNTQNLQNSTASQVAAVAEVTGNHHVLGVEHLLGQLGHANGAERAGAAAGQGSKSNGEEMQTRERDHVDSELAQVRVQLARETETSSDTRHDGGDQMVHITEGDAGQLEGLLADFVESMVVNTESLVRVLDQLVNRQGGIVRLNDGVGLSWGGNNGEGSHHTVRELFADLGDEQCTHSRTGSSTKGVRNLETLDGVAVLGLAANNVKNVLDQLSSLGVMTLGPVVASTGLSVDEVVGSEELRVGAGTDGVHGTGFEVDENGAGDILVSGGLVNQCISSCVREVVGAGG